MNLKDFLVRRNGEKELFWALVVEPGWVQAGIWEIGEEKAKVIALSPPTPWETDADLVGACDTALSASIQNLAEGEKEPSKTVFGVPPSWVSGGKIKEEYLTKIKTVCGELSLEPTGFVVLPEAIAHLFKSEEGSPLNAIVVGVGNQNLEIAVFRLGNLSGTTQVARSVSVTDDISEGLSRFAGGEALPSRFILYDGKEGALEEVRQAVINANWEGYEKIKFLHAPKVEIIPPDTKVIACALAGGAEIAHVSGVQTLKKEEPKEEETAPEKVGFFVGKDVGEKEVAVTSEQPAVEQKRVPTPPPKTGTFFSEALSSIEGFKPTLPTGFFARFTGKAPLFGLGFLLILIVLGFIFWWFFPKAEVTIFVSPRALEEKVPVRMDPDRKDPDLTAGILPGEILKTEVSGEKTKATSGTKTVGEKARGTVRIQNGTAANVNLSAGTTLIAANDLRYSLVESASVSAALSPTIPGTATAEVTAAAIGAEYNLAKDESFKVGNYPKAEVDAVATSDFSGGSSREISAVAPLDLTTLEEELTKELLDEAKDKISSELAPNKILIQESAVSKALSRTFSNKVDDEAANIQLSLDLEVTSLAIERKVLTDLSMEVLKGKTPEGFILRESQIEFTFEGKGGEEPNSYDLTISANFLPEVKSDEIAKKIAGRAPKVAETYLTSIPSFSRAEIKVTPRFPGRLLTLPHVAKRITIEVAKD